MKKIYLFLFAMLFTLSSFSQYSTHNFNFGGVNRQYLLYIPPAYDGSMAVPFVLVLHGLGDNMNNFKNVRFQDVADTANFIFAIPQALVDTVLTQSTAWNSGAGEYSFTLNPDVDDVGFLNALIDTVSSQYMIDSSRIYSTGFSMGGFMTNRLGCELNNRIAAIASVSGTIGNYINCNPTRVVPSCHFHGTADGTVSYTGDMFGSDAEALVAYWRGHDHCDSLPSTIDTLAHISNSTLRIVHYVYPNGLYNSDVEFYKVLGGQHQWLGPTGYDINYTVAIWDFFSQHKWEAQGQPAPTGITALSDKMDVKVFPNPAINELNIQLTASSNKTLDISIHDMMGRSVYTIQSAGNISINTANFAKGVYTVEAIADGQKISKKISLVE